MHRRRQETDGQDGEDQKQEEEEQKEAQKEEEQNQNQDGDSGKEKAGQVSRRSLFRGSGHRGRSSCPVEVSRTPGCGCGFSLTSPCYPCQRKRMRWRRKFWTREDRRIAKQLANGEGLTSVVLASDRRPRKGIELGEQEEPGEQENPWKQEKPGEQEKPWKQKPQEQEQTQEQPKEQEKPQEQEQSREQQREMKRPPVQVEECDITEVQMLFL